MTSIVFDYADIRSRMLGEDKPRPKKVEIDPMTLVVSQLPPMAIFPAGQTISRTTYAALFAAIQERASS